MASVLGGRSRPSLGEFAAEAELFTRPTLLKVRRSIGGNAPVVVSMTSHPGRITLVHHALRSVIGQTHRPEKVVLVLAEEEFGRRETPRSLSRLQRDGLEILWTTRNTRSYKKLLPVLEAFPASMVVTADDDVLYPRWWLERLVARTVELPDYILGHRGTEIGVSDGDLTPYETWPAAGRKTRGSRLFLTGNGGVAYPAGSLAPQVMDVELALNLCPTADDIWFKAMALLQGSDSALVGDKPRDFPTTRGSGAPNSLMHVNVGGGQNDVQMRAVLSHFGLLEILTDE
jgi:hypothetical protein